ncbi:MAG: YraN family protein [Gammaproteobacteria bacterium]|nr:MAG: YraN family protein [Gammaproteobacteria bacterium]
MANLSQQDKSKVAIGRDYETMGLNYLIGCGLTKITQNYYSRYGEIDLIMQDQNCIVFVECRFRKNSNYGYASESITPQKINKIKKTATHYLKTQKKLLAICRFDVIAIDNKTINWIKNAF